MDPTLLRQLVSSAAIFVAAAGLALFARRLVLSLLRRWQPPHG